MYAVVLAVASMFRKIAWHLQWESRSEAWRLYTVDWTATCYYSEPACSGQTTEQKSLFLVSIDAATACAVVAWLSGRRTLGEFPQGSCLRAAERKMHKHIRVC